MKKLLLNAFSALMLAAASLSVSATEVDLGYTTGQGTIWYATGLKFDRDVDAGVAIRIPASKIKNYVGSKIVKFKLGVGDGAKDTPVQLFVRTDSLNTPNLTTGSGKVTYIPDPTYQVALWNEVALDSALIISHEMETKDLYVGYYVTSPKDQYIIYTSDANQRAAENTVFLCMREHCNLPVDQDNQWFDALYGDEPNNSNVCLLAVLEMPDGSYENAVLVNNLTFNSFGTLGEPGGCIMYVRNDGPTPVSNVEVTTTLGEESKSETVALNLAVGAEPTRGVYLPLHYLGTGEHSIEITKVNGQPNDAAKAFRTTSANLVAVPAAVADEYIRRPLYEFYTDESQHYNPEVQDIWLRAGITNYRDRISFLPHHSNDKFGTNPEDVPVISQGQASTLTITDADRLAIQLAGNDASLVEIPSFAVDRTWVNNNNYTVRYSPFTLLRSPDVTANIINEMIATPTCGDVFISSTYNYETNQAKITVFGTISDGVLPQGEKLKLCVTATEEEVISDSQEFPDPLPAQFEGLYPDGLFSHIAVTRELITPFNGIEVEPGDFSKSFTLDVDPRLGWNPDHMKIVAYLARPESNARTAREVINSDEAPMTENYTQSGIAEVTTTSGTSVVYNIKGERMSGQLPAGLYIRHSGGVASKFIVR